MRFLNSTIFATVLLLLVTTLPASAITQDRTRQLAELAYKQGDIETAIAEYEKLIDNYNEQKIDTAYTAALKRAGSICFQANKLTKALRFFVVGMNAAQQIGDNHNYNACLGNIGSVYGLCGDYGSSIYYLEKAFNLCVQQGDTALASRYASNIIVTYTNMNNADGADPYLKFLREHPMDSTAMGEFYYLMGKFRVFSTRGITDTTLQVANQMIRLTTDNQMGNYFASVAYSALADAYKASNQFDKAVEASQRALQMAHEDKLTSFEVDDLNQLANIYAAMGDNTNEAHYRKLHQQLADSVMNKNDIFQAKSEMMQFQDQAYSNYTHSLNTTIRYQAVAIAVILAFLLALAALLYVNRRLIHRLKESNQVLYEKNQEWLRADEERQKRAQAQEMTLSSPEVDVNPEAVDVKNRELLDKIVAVMDNLDNITNPDFSLDTLVKMVGSNTHYVSKAINSGLNMSFRSYLNQRRIMEACRRLKDASYKNVSMQALGESVGFNSTSIFFTSFKKFVGMTPATYQKMGEDNAADGTSGDSLPDDVQPAAMQE